MIKAVLCFVLCIFSVTTLWAENGKVLRLNSPQGMFNVEFSQQETKGVNVVTYSVVYKGRTIVYPSLVGLDLDNRMWEKALAENVKEVKCWMDNMEVDSVVEHPTVDHTWTPLYGERNQVRNAYTSATMHLSKHDSSGYAIDIEVRAYDEGIAFRYFFPEHPKAIFHKVVADLTEYSFPEGTMAWTQEWAQAPFQQKNIAEIDKAVERALTLRLPTNEWVALLDADVDDWCLTKFLSSSEKSNTLVSVMYSPVDIVTYYATPWKIIMVADTAGELLEHNDIVMNLNPPCEIADAEEWIRPGKIMREVSLTTDGAMACIDFCCEHNIHYMLFDWKWYVPCTSHDGDATQVVDALDLPRVIDYGKMKGVGIWLYVNQHALMKQAKTLFPLFHEWGIVGVKAGFVEYASHRWAVWLHDLVRLAAENHLMINIHDEYRPSGFSRTYPNLLTQEGIRGNEEFPDATHNVTLPFTRMLNGAADYTICYYDNRLKTTHAHQLAASLVFYSPLQTIFWYDKPSDYENEPEIEWFDKLETTFDDSQVIGGKLGEYVILARRKGDTWFVAAMTNNHARDIAIPLNFLSREKKHKFIAHIYTDGGDDIHTKTHVKCQTLNVVTGEILDFHLQPSGGVAIRIEPIK